MSEADLRERRVYFEQRLAEAERMSIAKEPLPAKFSSGFTTEKPKRGLTQLSSLENASPVFKINSK